MFPSHDRCGGTYIAYCFAEVEGFSNFGSYVGNLSSQTNIVTGFEPAFVIIKCSSGFNSGRWFMWDNKRSPSNINQKVFFADLATAEEDNIVFGLNFLENGFSIPTTTTSNSVNQTGYTYIYMAFAADPTTIEPSLEDSFNTVLFEGNGTSQTITGVGFQPDFVWFKSRDNTWNNNLLDAVRGEDKFLSTDLTSAEGIGAGLFSFGSDGFSVNGGGGVNANNESFVTWCWKGAEIPAINSNGSIPSVVSANPAAGFSIVSYTVNSSSDDGKTVGHGLNDDPKIIIIKNRTLSGDWIVTTTVIDGSYDYLRLNKTDAKGDYTGINAPTEDVFTNTTSNASDIIAYCFAEVAGFSKFGSYSGTGSAGNAQTLGFEPAFVMAKRTDAASGWLIVDNKRNGTANYELFAHSSDAEYAYDRFLFNSNGFEFNSSAFNESGSTWIYMAFANQF